MLSINYFTMTLAAKTKKATVALCADCMVDLQEWLAMVPQGYLKQIQQLETMAAAGR